MTSTRTPEHDAEIVERMAKLIFAHRAPPHKEWGDFQYEQSEYRTCARAALAVARPDIERAALERAAGAIERLVDTDKIRRECCGNGRQSSYNEPPECCGDPDLLVTLGDAAAAVRALIPIEETK